MIIDSEKDIGKIVWARLTGKEPMWAGMKHSDNYFVKAIGTINRNFCSTWQTIESSRLF